MENGEIRARARRLYQKHFGLVLLLGFCSIPMFNVIDSLIDCFLDNDIMQIILMIVHLAVIPLTVGAIACIEPLWMEEQETSKHLFAFYQPFSKLVDSVLLGVLPLLFTFVLVIPSALIIFEGDLSVVIFWALLIFLFWVIVRLQMATMLFASGREKSAWNAFSASFRHMRGKVLDFLSMFFILFIPQMLFGIVPKVLTQSGFPIFALLLIEIVFDVLYFPYSMLATQGWVLERLKDGEQPQESENKKNQPPFVPNMTKGVEEFRDKP